MLSSPRETFSFLIIISLFVDALAILYCLVIFKPIKHTELKLAFENSTLSTEYVNIGCSRSKDSKLFLWIHDFIKSQNSKIKKQLVTLLQFYLIDDRNTRHRLSFKTTGEIK